MDTWTDVGRLDPRRFAFGLRELRKARDTILSRLDRGTRRAYKGVCEQKAKDPIGKCAGTGSYNNPWRTFRAR